MTAKQGGRERERDSVKDNNRITESINAHKIKYP